MVTIDDRTAVAALIALRAQANRDRYLASSDVSRMGHVKYSLATVAGQNSRALRKLEREVYRRRSVK